MDRHQILDSILSRMDPFKRNFTILSYFNVGVWKGSKLSRVEIVKANFRIIRTIYRERKSENPVVVREFSNLLWVFFAIFVSPKRRPNIVLNINHNISGFSSLYILNILEKRGFKLMLINGDIAKYELNMPKLLTPNNEIKVLKNYKNKLYDICVVGDLRKEKVGDMDIRSVFKRFDEQSSFVLGYRNEALNIVSQEVSTSEQPDFANLLLSSRYVLILAGPNYFYRHSGTIWEAIMHGCGVIIPNYPVFLSQVRHSRKFIVYTDLDFPSIDKIILQL